MDSFIKERPVAIILCLAIVIVLLVMVVVWNIRQTALTFDSTLNGMWIASTEFCNKSDIDGMMLYINSSGSKCSAYLIMYANNVIILSKNIEIAFAWTPNLPNSILTKTAQIYEVISEDEPQDELDFNSIIPRNQTITLDISTGHMTWSSYDPEQDDIVQYAEFYKDAISTNSANL